MREYALHRAESYGEYGVASAISRFIRNWQARRAVARLVDLDDYMLRDIGVSRDDLSWAKGLPLTVNAALALEERSISRRRGRKV